MLSDFDLSKPTGEPGGAPAVMKQSAQGGVSGHPSFVIAHLADLPSGTPGHGRRYAKLLG